MHEMSLAEGVLQLVEETAMRENAQRVKLVVLEIGRLSSVEPEALRFCFEAVVDGKVASYRVQAPTDSYFADASALSSLLGNLEFASLDHARQALNQAILALDPCLPYEVELHDA